MGHTLRKNPHFYQQRISRLALEGIPNKSAKALIVQPGQYKELNGDDSDDSR